MSTHTTPYMDELMSEWEEKREYATPEQVDMANEIMKEAEGAWETLNSAEAELATLLRGVKPKAQVETLSVLEYSKWVEVPFKRQSPITRDVRVRTHYVKLQDLIRLEAGGSAEEVFKYLEPEDQTFIDTGMTPEDVIEMRKLGGQE
jgi:hypothetical protein